MNEAYTDNYKTSALATAALILGIIAALGLVFVFPPFICGATAITLGFLSRSDEGLSLRAKIGICMGILSIVLLIIITVSAINFLIDNPDVYRHFTSDFNEFYNEIYQELMEQEGGFI